VSGFTLAWYDTHATSDVQWWLAPRDRFSCDKLPAAGKIASHLKVLHKYSDIEARPDPPDVDLYVFGPPCQAFSKNGKQLGAADPVNGTLTLRSLMYIAKHKPSMILMEQVTDILLEKHRELWELIKKTLTNAGYYLTTQVCQSWHFGVPQSSSCRRDARRTSP
jgi:site-specific DNA-cytosine methylase